MEHFNQYQYDDMLIRQVDPYANAKYNIITSYLASQPPLRILNAGCGSGELSFLLAAAGHTIVGIDPAPHYIALAQKLLPKEFSTRCSFEVGSIEKAKFAEPFDIVVATDVLEHIEDDRRAANKLAQLVAPGGLLVVTVPAMPFLFGFHDEKLGHFRRYSASQLRRLMAGTGSVRLEKLRYFGFSLIPVCLWYSKILRRPYPVAAAGEAGTLRAVLLKALLALDCTVPLPLGTSLILFARKA